jgi:ribosomal protein S18 acetylase RimI-like enzyme
LLTIPKIQYRLAKSSGLNIGLFTTVSPEDGTNTLPTYTTARSTETGSPRKSVLVAHILATLTDHETVHDEDMALPKDWNTSTPDTSQGFGHKPGTRTAALHSLSVLPDLQASRVGSTLLRTFIQMIKDAKIVDRIALLTFERLVPWYERFGFENLGKSSAQYAGEEWYDMVRATSEIIHFLKV